MQEAKKDNRGKYTYVTDHADFNAASKHEISACRSCLSWEQKTQDLIWGYEQLLSAKEKELETVTNMVNQLDEKLKKSYLKIENLNKKIQGYENQIDKVKGSQQNHEGVISYYKEREAELLLQLKSTEN
jgi:peptidoglycan hydrolase CwlO-like protein